MQCMHTLRVRARTCRTASRRRCLRVLLRRGQQVWQVHPEHVISQLPDQRLLAACCRQLEGAEAHERGRHPAVPRAQQAQGSSWEGGWVGAQPLQSPAEYKHTATGIPGLALAPRAPAHHRPRLQLRVPRVKHIPQHIIASAAQAQRARGGNLQRRGKRAHAALAHRAVRWLHRRWRTGSMEAEWRPSWGPKCHRGWLGAGAGQAAHNAKHGLPHGARACAHPQCRHGLRRHKLPQRRPQHRAPVSAAAGAQQQQQRASVRPNELQGIRT